MRYADARCHIKTGDIVGVCGRGLFAWATRTLQRWAHFRPPVALVNHVGVAWWLEGRLYIVETNRHTNGLRPLSQYVDDGINLIVVPCPVGRVAMAEQFAAMTAHHIPYDLADIIAIGWRLLRRASEIDATDDDQLVCTALVARWLLRAGWSPPTNTPHKLCPAETLEAIGGQLLVITP